jgi:hypothetical protein
MSIQSSAVANYRVLASILSDIGASQFLPNFIEAEHDDSCIHSFRVAKSVEKLYGLPLELAAKFVEKCRAVAARGAQPAGDNQMFRLWLAQRIDALLLAFKSFSFFEFSCAHIKPLHRFACRDAVLILCFPVPPPAAQLLF